MGILVEYAYRRGEPQYAPPGDEPWDYLRFGRSPKESPKPDEVIPMRILRVAPDEHGMERWSINGHIYSDREEPKVLSSRTTVSAGVQQPDARGSSAYTCIAIPSNWSGSAHIATAGVKKDVITLQPYQTAEVDFVPREAGLALFHCHQQMHMEMGFKRLFRVI